MPMVMPICTVETEQLKNLHIAGSAGLYISFMNEPKALSITM